MQNTNEFALDKSFQIYGICNLGNYKLKKDHKWARNDQCATAQWAKINIVEGSGSHQLLNILSSIIINSYFKGMKGK